MHVIFLYSLVILKSEEVNREVPASCTVSLTLTVFLYIKLIVCALSKSFSGSKGAHVLFETSFFVLLLLYARRRKISLLLSYSRSPVVSSYNSHN